jgi:hypothetical protein
MLTAAMKKVFSPKVIIILICSFIAGIGTTPYGFRFAQVLDHYNYFLFLSVGGLFAMAALFANMALGSYSLMNVNFKQKLINTYYLMAGSTVSALPFGFICYFGFKNYLPFFINLITSIIVFIVNTGISYSALYNFLLDKKNQKIKKISPDLKFVQQLGFVIGFFVSITVYVATAHGMTHLLTSITGNPQLAFYTASIVAIFSWIPFLALYASSTKIVSERIYVSLLKNVSKINKVNKLNLLFIAIAIGSGASFTQIAIDFFNPTTNIPSFFKTDTIQSFIYQFIVPCAFFSSASVNYLALKRLAEKIKI